MNITTTESISAISRLLTARADFDQTWRAHIAAMRAATIISYSKPIASSLAASLSMARKFDPKFDTSKEIEDIFEELEWLKDDLDFHPLRINCLLGVCASFEAFSKSVAAALSYDPNWQATEGQVNCLYQDTSLDFHVKFKEVDKDWKNGKGKFLKTNFDWLDEKIILNINSVFWIRNQITHNAGYASEDKTIGILDESFIFGEKILINQIRLKKIIDSVLDCMNRIATKTPYLQAI